MNSSLTQSLSFLTASSELLANPSVVLVAEGLDTISTVLVNGVQVGSSENMFVRYVYDIKPALVVSTTFTDGILCVLPHSFCNVVSKSRSSGYARFTSLCLTL